MTSTRRPGLPPLVLGGLYAVLTAAPLIIALATGEAHRVLLVRAAAGAGMAAGVMLLLQLVTSGRFEAISGRIGIDVTMAFHKWAAPVALALAVLHVLLLIGPPDADRPGRVERRFWAMLTGEGLGDARWALGLLAVLVTLALLRDRLPLRYELWRAGHALLALAMVGTMLWHVVGDGRGGLAPWFWLLLAASVLLPAAGVYLRRLTAPGSAEWTVAESRKVADRLWEVTLAPNAGQRLDFRAGQFAWLTLGRHRLPLFDHPFSMASAPGEARPRFLIQEAGDFTGALDRLRRGTRAALDAPHGSFGPDPECDGAILLIAGGVGIAPILSVLGNLAATGCTRPVRLIYAGRDPGAMLGAEFWGAACLKLGCRPLLLADTRAAAAGMMPGPLTEDHLRQALQGVAPAEAQALICGPGPMMTFATDALVRLGVPLRRIDYERFSYSARGMSVKDRRMLLGFLATWAAVGAAVVAYSLV